MNLKVPREVIDALTEQGNLYLGRPSIGPMEFKLLNNLMLLLLSNPHVSSVFSFLLFSFVLTFYHTGISL